MGIQHHEDADGEGMIAELNVIPLVDILLVLLIIFMIAAPISISGLPIELPQSQAKGVIPEEEKIVLTITQKGEYFLDKSAIPGATLADKLKAIYQFRQKKEIFIRADKNVVYSAVIDAMSAAKMAGVTKVGMLTQAVAKPL